MARKRTGRTIGPIVNRERKRDLLESLAQTVTHARVGTMRNLPHTRRLLHAPLSSRASPRCR